MRITRTPAKWIPVTDYRRRPPPLYSALGCTSAHQFRCACVLVILVVGGFYIIVESSNSLNVVRVPKQYSLLENSWRPQDFMVPSITTSRSIGCRRDVKRAALSSGLTFLCSDPISLKRNLSLPVARDRYYRHMLNLEARCGQPELMGRLSDGGWWTCRHEAFTFKQPCLAYSFGIRRGWSFEETISMKYGCEVHVFDPSLNTSDHMVSPGVYFHRVNLAGKNVLGKHQWLTRTFCTLINDLGHENRTIDYLKLDLEFGEWPSLSAMLTERCLYRVKQIAMETHAWMDSVDHYVLYWQILQGLQNEGFQKWRLNNRNWRCHNPRDDLKTRRCPQADLNYINVRYVPKMARVVR